MSVVARKEGNTGGEVGSKGKRKRSFQEVDGKLEQAKKKPARDGIAKPEDDQGEHEEEAKPTPPPNTVNLPSTGPVRFFVSGLSDNVTAEELRDRFQGAGQVLDVSICRENPKNPQSRCKGFGHLTLDLKGAPPAKCK